MVCSSASVLVVVLWPRAGGRCWNATTINGTGCNPAYCDATLTGATAVGNLNGTRVITAANVNTERLTVTNRPVADLDDGDPDGDPGSATADYCGPESAFPEEPCDNPFVDSDADAAVRAEPDLASDADSPLIVGDPSNFAPSPSGLAASGPLVRRGWGWMLADQKRNVFTTVVPGTTTRADRSLRESCTTHRPVRRRLACSPHHDIPAW